MHSSLEVQYYDEKISINAELKKRSTQEAHSSRSSETKEHSTQEAQYSRSAELNPIPGRGGVRVTPPSIFFNIAQKLLELLAYNFFTFPKYEFNMFS